MADAQLQKQLLGQNDARSTQGILSRGSNVYNGGSSAAHSGGGNPNLGRPRTSPVEGSPDNSVQSVFQKALDSGNNTGASGPIDMNPKPIVPYGAIQRRVLGGQRGN